MSVRAGVVGLGSVADRIHFPACQAVPEIDIAGVCDPDPIARQRMAKAFPIAHVFAGVDEMLRAIRPDFVIVGAPPGAHFAICERALEAGVHVFCEKPFMTTLDEADRIVELARQRNLLVRVNNQYRFMSFYRDTFERLRRGEFGRLFYIQAWQQMFHPPDRETNWRRQLTRNVLFEFGTHALDLVSFFFEALPVSVNAHMPRCRPEYASDVLVNMALRFPEERLASFSFNRVSHAPEKYLEMRLDCEQASLRLSLGGVARLSAEWSRNAGGLVTRFAVLKGGQARAEVNGRSRTYRSSPRTEFASATAEHLRLFLSEMRQPARPLAAALHARDMLRLVFAGYESAASGETVRL